MRGAKNTNMLGFSCYHNWDVVDGQSVDGNLVIYIIFVLGG